MIMYAYLHHIETLLPPFAYRQDYARDRMMAWLPGRRTRRLIRGICPVGRIIPS